MDVAILFSGEFGKRFVLNLVYPKLCCYFGACGIERCDYCKDYDFGDRIRIVKEFPEPMRLPSYIEDVNGYLSEIDSDAVIAINLHPDLLAELPNYADCKLLIAPACDQRWCMSGLKKQIERRCEEIGIEFYSPKPFCNFNPKRNFGKRFAEYFSIGMPKFRVRVEENVIRDVKVVRSDPCGCSYYVAKMMRNYCIEDVREFWKDIHQHQCAYPCLASMERDIELNNEAPFHLAGYIMVFQFSKAAGIDATEFVPKHFREVVVE